MPASGMVYFSACSKAYSCKFPDRAEPVAHTIQWKPSLAGQRINCSGKSICAGYWFLVVFEFAAVVWGAIAYCHPAAKDSALALLVIITTLLMNASKASCLCYSISSFTPATLKAGVPERS